MSRFEKDMELTGFELDVCIRKRKEELDELEKKGKSEKNKFRVACIAQEFVRLKKEYKLLSEKM